MKKVHELLSERRYFTGRVEQLAMMSERLSQKNESWGILHLHGAAGMGKTALLNQFARNNPSIPSVYIHANPAFHHPEQFEQAVYRSLLQQRLIRTDEQACEGHASELLNQLAMKHGTLLLLLDGLSEWTEIEHWIREEWLLSLTTNIKVFSAGRQPLIRWQTSDSWAQLIQNAPLGPLPKSDWVQYAAHYGITNLPTIDFIGRVSEGVPLAIQLICNTIRSLGDKWNPEQDQRSLLDIFESVILHPDNLSGVDRLLLDVASLVYSFDHEMLEFILGQPIPTAEFQRLCQSSFVRVHPECGWSISNGIRRWAKEGLKRRSPEAYEQYKHRAEQILERRAAAAADHFMNSGKMFLHDNDVIHGFIYYDDGQPYLRRSARREDLPLLEAMYRSHIVAYPENHPDPSHQEQYLIDVWNTDPSFISVFEHAGRLAGFYAALPLNHPQLREMLDRNPATRAFAACTLPEPNDWLYWLVASDPPLDQGFSGHILRTMLHYSLPGNRITMMMPSAEFAEAANIVGFQEVPEAFYSSTDGCSFYFYQLDARSPALAIPSADIMQADSEEWADIAKKLLASYSQLESQALILKQCQHKWGTKFTGKQLVRYVQNTIISEWKRLNQGSLKEKKLAQILYYAYMHKIGTHEVVMERLDLPSSTYYRHLNRLIREIARSLQCYRGVD